MAVFVFAPLRLEHFWKSSIVKAVDSEFDWIDSDGFEHIDGEVVWPSGEHLIEKGLQIESTGTLIIEKGAKILFATSPDFPTTLSVSGDGRIFASGTREEKISFSSVDPNERFSINFMANSDGQISFFRYVDFVGTKFSSNGGGGVSWGKNFFGQTALAAQTFFSSVLDYSSGKVHVENSTFKNGSVNVSSYIPKENNAGFLEIVNSNFDFDENGIAVTSDLRCDQSISSEVCKNHFLLKNNWYGNFLGPMLDGEIVQRGLSISGQCKLDGWKVSDLVSDPVLVVPGIMGAGQFLGKWQLDPISHTYDDLVASLEKNGFVKDVSLFDFPYDWRINNETNARYLQARVEGIVSQTKVSKVDVVAHSIGGLIARAYVEEIDGAQYQDTINKLITLATPNGGSPAAYLKWEASEGFFALSDKIAKNHFQQEAEHAGYSDLLKYIQEKIPTVKELLPINDYLEDAATGAMRAYPSGYPRNTFLEDLNLDVNLEKLKKVQYVAIVGNLESNRSTISKIRVTESSIVGKWQDGMPENFYDTKTDRGLTRYFGDETVPLASATSIPADKSIEIKASHQELPDSAQCDVFKELTGKTVCDFMDKWHMTNILLIDVFSPIDIQIISPSGKKIGKNFDTGGTFDEIDGAFYSGFDSENEFVTIPNPEDGEYRILTQGTGDGNFRVEAVKIVQDPVDQTKSTESVAIINGVASVGAAKELKVSVVGETVKDSNAPVVPPVVDVPPVVHPTPPPVVTPPIVTKDDHHGSSHKKSHKKKKKASTRSKKILQTKKAIAFNFKNSKQKIVSSTWQNVSKITKSWKDVILSPIKFFRR